MTEEQKLDRARKSIYNVLMDVFLELSKNPLKQEEAKKARMAALAYKAGGPTDTDSRMRLALEMWEKVDALQAEIDRLKTACPGHKLPVFEDAESRN